MNEAFYVGAIGLQAQQRALDIIAGNIANVNTPAFKRLSVRFSDVLANHADPDVPRADLDDTAATLAGVRVDAASMVNEDGPIETTGQSMDVAVSGKGFIEVMGDDGQAVLWRGGTMKVGDDGLLSTSSGLALRAAITVPDDTTALTIDADGTVRAKTGDALEATEIGQIELVTVDDASALTRMDGGLYRIDDGARATGAKPGEDGVGTLVQGGLERSNVEMTTEMVQLMLVQRAYGANAQVLQAADQLMAMANGLRR